MTYDEKMKCVELYEMCSEISTTPEMWNDEAADILAEMYAEMLSCTNKIHFVPKPVGSRPGWSWLINYAYQVIRERFFGKSREIYEMCRVTVLRDYKTAINIALAGVQR